MHSCRRRLSLWSARLLPVKPLAPAKPALEVLEDRVMLSGSTTAAASAYQQWRQTTFTINDTAVAPAPAASVSTTSTTPTNASFGSLIGLNQVLASSPDRGQGYTVAVIDTGIDYDNPDLGGGWGKRVIAGYNFVNNTSDPMDDNGHGTAVASIIGSSSGTNSGLAPDCNFVALKVLDASGTGSYGAVDDALQWVAAHQAQYNIVAVNMSLGSGDFTTLTETYLESDFTKLLAQGVFIAVAAGNDYYGSAPGLAYPAVSPNVVSVGAVWDGSYGQVAWASGAIDYRSAPDQICSFSQRDSNLSLLAPGAMVDCDYLNDTFEEMAGTSMASPVVAGAALLLHQALVSAGETSLANQAGILQILQNTGVSVTDTNAGQDNVTHTGLTFKRVDVEAAMQYVASTSQTLALAPIADQVVASGLSSTIPLSASAPGNAAVTLTASVTNATSVAGQAYQLKQQLGLSYAGSYYLNAWGEDEKWLQGTGGTWYMILPDGELRKWAGTMSLTLQPANLVADLGASYYDDPSLLWNAQPAATTPILSAAIVNGQLVLTAVAGATGSGTVTVTASAAGQTVTQSLNVSVVAPAAPQLGSIAAPSVTAGQAVGVLLPGSDSDGEPLIYTAQILGSFASPPAVLSLSGDQLTVESASGYAGTFAVQVTVSNGTGSTTGTFNVTVTPAVTVVDKFTGDFTGNGKVDTLEFMSDGSWWLTPPGGTATEWSQWLPAADWKTVLVGDFNGDGKLDVAGFNNDGSWWVGLSTGSSFVTSMWAQWLPATSWVKVMVGNFNGDGKTDIVGFSDDGSWWVGTSTGSRFATSMWAQWLNPQSWNLVSVGDFNGDGKTDVVGFNNDGSWWVGTSTGTRFTTALWAQWSAAAAWSWVGVGDFNGDGKSDVVGFNNDGSWWVGLSTGTRFVTSMWAQWSPAAGWTAVGTADVNGDGKTDVVGQNADGSWWVGYSTGHGFTTSPWTPPASQSTTIQPAILDATASGEDGPWSAWLGLTTPRRAARGSAERAAR